ncbi:uncharacterized protein B0T23DRAFT_448652 [Neurospora hispaniola]|uniref:Uncharacterized protein n=1 Tax=Neurospora hispaniola TaxID=588809 RepID=A0AAJ0HZH5_9PEZI|nr:hypothetical protein B0T23DRAFT_448652 [Neurospora hispaniola]
MSQPNPITPIHPLFVFLFDTERFFLDTLKNSNNMDPAIHTKLKTAFQKFRKWGLDNHNHLVSIADDLENSEVHKPKNYKAYQMLFWRFRGMWPNVCLVQQILKDQATATCTSRDRPPAHPPTAKTSSSGIHHDPSQQNPTAPPPPPPVPTNISTQNTTTTTTTTTTTSAILFSRFKSPVMLPFAKWWAESQDKREGPLLPALSFEEAVEGICSSISLIVDDWEIEIVPLLVVSDVVQVHGLREVSGGPGAGAGGS